ncbi:MAG: glycoside hydrolase family 65 protein [Actinomycetota bacterium]|nr:glycoside hydrolase family 65 protein [Actinomycetota bacterium]
MSEDAIPEPVRAPGWSLHVASLRPEREAAVAAAFELGDGRVGVAGSPIVEDPAARPGVKAPGLFHGDGADSKLLPLPDSGRFELDHGDGMQVERTLDLRSGLLYHRVREGASELSAVIFCSLARPGTVVMRAAGGGELLRPGAPLRLPTPVTGVRGPEPPVTVGSSADTGSLVEDEGDGSLRVVRARGTPGGAVVAARQRCDRGVLDRLAAYVVDGRRLPDARDARRLLEEAERSGFDQLFSEQRNAWRRRWESCDIVVDGDRDLQVALRLAMFHLVSLIDSSGEAAVGARGTTGEAYRGHVFWDADIFVLPFAAATYPAAARAMLRYRARRLVGARAYAAEHGHAGARFPWESAATGEEVTPRTRIDHRGEQVEVLTGALEEHITADVAWGAVHYLAWTGDDEFARGDGMALLVETARYWHSRVERDADGSCHIRGVIGPDEYHERVDDNAYTNVMARWNLRAAAEHVARYAGNTGDGEVRGWLATADAIVDGYDPRTRLYEQFSGFYELTPLLATAVAERPFSGPRLLGYERIAESQVIKQTDVLMMHLNVPQETAPGSLEPNLNFYEPRTAHESSLSPGSSAEALARAGRPDEALCWLRETAFIDLPQFRPVKQPGLHTAAMGNTWRAVALGMMGVSPTPDALRVDPRLPGEWPSLELRVRYRGSLVRLRADRNSVTLNCDRPTRVCLAAGPTVTVGPGETALA